MTIRRLLPGDAAAYRTLMLEAYERHPDAFTSSAAERAALPLSWWEVRLAPEPQPDSLVLGAFEGERLAGVVGLSFESREKMRHKAMLFGMYVAPNVRRGGLGRRLVLAALEEARRRGGIRVVQLTVSAGNAGAQALYEQCGFAPFGVEPLAFLVGPDLVSKVHMWCDLETAGRPRGADETP
jgi:ribosomal protein S18 acetylase RimI-like enzyme